MRAITRDGVWRRCAVEILGFSTISLAACLILAAVVASGHRTHINRLRDSLGVVPEITSAVEQLRNNRDVNAFLSEYDSIKAKYKIH